MLDHKMQVIKQKPMNFTARESGQWRLRLNLCNVSVIKLKKMSRAKTSSNGDFNPDSC